MPRCCGARRPLRNADRRGRLAPSSSRSKSPRTLTRAPRLATAAYEKYESLRLLKGPIQGVYLTIFLAVTLLILISATWLGLYLAKRITRPVQRLAEGARAIGAGQFDVRLEAETRRRAGLARRGIQHDGGRAAHQPREARAVAAAIWSRRTSRSKARRRYIETILERVATGVISLDDAGRISTVNGAAERLLGLGSTAVGHAGARGASRGRTSSRCCRSSTPSHGVSRGASSRRSRSRATTAKCIWRPRPRRSRAGPASPRARCSSSTTSRRSFGRSGSRPGATWRDGSRTRSRTRSRRSSSSAERLRRHFSAAPAPTAATRQRVHRRDHRRGRGAEGAGRRVRAVRAPARPAPGADRPQSADRRHAAALRRRAAAGPRAGRPAVRASGLPPVQLDAEQIRQVIINLVDNAIEALGGPNAAIRPVGPAADDYDHDHPRRAQRRRPARRDRQRAGRAAGRP